jgi:branched-chain amino acid transport system permease protein
MFAVLVGRVVPDSFGLVELIFHFAMVMVEDSAAWPAVCLRCDHLTALPEYFRSFPGLEEMFFVLFLSLFFCSDLRGCQAFCALPADVSPAFLSEE